MKLSAYYFRGETYRGCYVRSAALCVQQIGHQHRDERRRMWRPTNALQSYDDPGETAAARSGLFVHWYTSVGCRSHRYNPTSATTVGPSWILTRSAQFYAFPVAPSISAAPSRCYFGGADNAGQDNDGQHCRGGKRVIWKWRTEIWQTKT